jgi:uncharacterized repeat protein (TIGR03843 family)
MAGPEPSRERLETAPVEVVGRFMDASNATLLVRLLDRDDTPLPDGAGMGDLDPTDLAVYKPQRGETPLWDFPDGTLHRRELAAHLVSEVLGWDLVPTTVIRQDGPFGVGALQRFVPHDPEQHYFTLRDQGDPSVLERLQRVVLFDIVVNNADRKASHVLVEVEAAGGPGAADALAGAHLWAIDHGVTFHEEYKLRTVAWDFALTPVPDDLRADVARLADWLAGPGASELADLLDLLEIDALGARAASVADLDIFPEPVGPRPYPWPLL